MNSFINFSIFFSTRSLATFIYMYTIAANKSVRYFSNGEYMSVAWKREGKSFEERKKKGKKKQKSEQKKSVLRINVSRYYYYCMHSPARLIKFEVAHNANTQTMAIANLFNCKLKMRRIAKIYSTRSEKDVERCEQWGRELPIKWRIEISL